MPLEVERKENEKQIKNIEKEVERAMLNLSSSFKELRNLKISANLRKKYVRARNKEELLGYGLCSLLELTSQLYEKEVLRHE